MQHGSISPKNSSVQDIHWRERCMYSRAAPRRDDVRSPPKKRQSQSTRRVRPTTLNENGEDIRWSRRCCIAIRMSGVETLWSDSIAILCIDYQKRKPNYHTLETRKWKNSRVIYKMVEREKRRISVLSPCSWYDIFFSSHDIPSYTKVD